MPSICPACASPASGKFCSECGAPLSRAEPLECRQCGNEIPLGGRFCNMCGLQVASSKEPPAPPVQVEPRSSRASTTTLLVAGGTVLVLVAALVIVLPRLGRGDPAPSAGAPFAPSAASTAGNPAAIDLGSMTPEEAAYRLFARVMTSVSAGDSAAARQFAPMAISAYRLVGELDLDARYHVVLLYLANNDPEGARATADQILDEVPNHLFGLYAAGQAEQAMGNDEAARSMYERFLAHYERELAIERFEYSEHASVLPPMREIALDYIGQASAP